MGESRPPFPFIRDRRKASTPYAGALSYGYDSADRLTSATDLRQASATSNYDYDAADRLTSQTLPSGIVTRRGYDAVDRLLSVATHVDDSPSSAVVESYVYTRTLTGQIASEIAANGRSETYAYDDSDRLARQIIAGDLSGENGQVDYTLDAIGNRRARASTVPGLPSQNFNYDVNHAIDGYDYDDHGNPVSGSVVGQAAGLAGPISDSYDFRHALAAREARVTYLYDGDGQRIGRRVWNSVAGAWDDTFYLNDSLPSAANPLGLSQTLEERASGGALQPVNRAGPTKARGEPACQFLEMRVGQLLGFEPLRYAKESGPTSD